MSAVPQITSSSMANGCRRKERDPISITTRSWRGQGQRLVMPARRRGQTAESTGGVGVACQSEDKFGWAREPAAAALPELRTRRRPDPRGNGPAVLCFALLPPLASMNRPLHVPCEQLGVARKHSSRRCRCRAPLILLWTCAHAIPKNHHCVDYLGLCSDRIFIRPLASELFRVHKKKIHV
jgi:hypothetical protein